MTKLSLALAFFTAGIVTAACSSSDSSSGSSGSSGTTDGGASSGVTEVTVKSNVFEPKDVTIKKGEKIRWKWAGGSHNVVSGASCTEDGKFKSGAPTAASGTTFEHTFDAAGKFEYFCTPHCSMGMTGTVTVQ